MDPVNARTNDDAWQRAEQLAATSQPTPTSAPPQPAARTLPVDVQPPAVLAGDALPRKFLESAAAASAQPVVLRDARDVQTQQRLDAFMAASSGPYRTPDGKEVRVTPPFQMAGLYKKQWETVATHAAELTAAAAHARLDPGVIGRIQAGRGTPTEIRAMTQALLDAKPLGAATSAEDVREMMFKYGLGIDCAGYTQVAFLAATGMTRQQAGFRAPGLEDLSQLGRQGFKRLPDDASDLRPGDLVVLGNPPNETHDAGHRAIVYDSHRATPAEMKELVDGASAQRDFSLGGPVRIIQVDSSFGSGGHFESGGVERQRWYHNESTGQWAYETRTMNGGASFTVTDRPYDHPVEGFFRKEP
jgi:hypothetical protein